MCMTIEHLNLVADNVRSADSDFPKCAGNIGCTNWLYSSLELCEWSSPNVHVDWVGERGNRQRYMCVDRLSQMCRHRRPHQWTVEESRGLHIDFPKCAGIIGHTSWLYSSLEVCKLTFPNVHDDGAYGLGSRQCYKYRYRLSQMCGHHRSH